MKYRWVIIVFVIVVFVILVDRVINNWHHKISAHETSSAVISSVAIPALRTILSDSTLSESERRQLMYGRELVAHTSKYFGPHGNIAHHSNGMNCQNCHLDAGTKSWGNSFAAVFATYPKYRSRSHSIQDLQARINDCFKRSLNGIPPDSNSREMNCMIAYINWVGKNVPKGTKPDYAGVSQIAYLERASDSAQGELIYKGLCQTCHKASGGGFLSADGKEYIYPPLWGDASYNDGAGLFRLSSMAAFLLNNMPFGKASHTGQVLTTEQAWDLAAFVNSKPRPHFLQIHDYPIVSEKPVDFPFGPYADQFSETRHKYGPYPAMLRKNHP